MFASERRNEILNILTEKSKVKVKELSKGFGVSEVIIRKDLKLLEEEGKLERTHGGAILKRQLPVNVSLEYRKISNTKGKKKIAQKIYDIIQDGEIVFLDCSSTNLFVSELLLKKPKKITLITNMLDIMKCIDKVKEIELISIGGVYHSEEGAFWGQLALENIKNLNFQKLFLGGAGIDIMNESLSILNETEGILKKMMISKSKKTYFIAEKAKFSTYGLYNFATLDKIDGVIVDEKINENYIKKLKEKEIEII